MIKTIDIGFAKFTSPRVEELEDYYKSIVGLQSFGASDGTSYLASRSGSLALSLEEAETTRLHGVAFVVDPDASVADMVAELSESGVHAERRTDPHPGIEESVRLVDPNGLEIELLKEMPLSYQADPVGVGAMRIGHVSVLTNDVNKAHAFYTAVLGIKVGDWVGDFFLFLRSNYQHHNINFIQSEQRRMHHVAFELQNTSELLSSCDVLARSSIPLVWGPVRHGPGHNIATYHKNPQEQIVELFTEMDVMSNEANGFYDCRPWQTDQPQRPKVWATTGPRRDIWGPVAPEGFLGMGT